MPRVTKNELIYGILSSGYYRAEDYPALVAQARRLKQFSLAGLERMAREARLQRFGRDALIRRAVEQA